MLVKNHLMAVHFKNPVTEDEKYQKSRKLVKLFLYASFLSCHIVATVTS